MSNGERNVISPAAYSVCAKVVVRAVPTEDASPPTLAAAAGPVPPSAPALEAAAEPATATSEGLELTLEEEPA